MSRKILCPNCASLLNEDVLKQKKSENTCLVCGASLDGDDTEKPVKSESEELVTWYYYDLGGGTYYLDDKYTEDDEDLTFTFQAPKDLEEAEKVLRREYKTDAFKEPESDNVIKPDALWIKEGKCPRCHSSNIQLVPRKWSIWTGFRTNKVDRVCVNCKHRF